MSSGTHISGSKGPTAADVPLDATFLSPLVLPGSTVRLSVSSAPKTQVRITIAVPERRTSTRAGGTDKAGHHHAVITVTRTVTQTISGAGVTDKIGRLVFAITIPKGVALHNGRAVVHIVLQAIKGKRRATTTTQLSVTDMLVTLALGRVARCHQTQEVRVAYHPNVPLRITLLFPHNYRIPIDVRTNRVGQAMTLLGVVYAKANDPVRIGVQVIDARAHTHRSEQATIAVQLPGACKK